MRTNRPYVQIDPDVLERIRQIDLLSYLREFEPSNLVNAEVDVIARAEDASKISRIVERFNLASVDTASIVTEAEKSKDAKDGQPEPDIGVQEKAEKDKLLDELMGKPVQKEENAPNPSVAKTEKSPQSEPT